MNHSQAGQLGAVISNQIQQDKMKKRVAEYEKQPVLCGYCHTPIPYNKRRNKFCNQSCGASHNNHIYPKRPASPEVVRKSTTNHCKYCNKEIPAYRLFCNTICRKQHQWEEKKGEMLLKGCTEGNKRPFKRMMIEMYGHRCSVCGMEEWMKQPIPLVLDHIDGNASNGDIKNLRLVCGNCDMQLPTYKGKNMGNGRSWRKQRYAKGKSY